MPRKPCNPVDGYDAESLRRELVAAVNSTPRSRADLERAVGAVLDASELAAAYEVEGFMAPVVCVRRKHDGQRGTFLFQHEPRFYWGWEEDCDKMA